MLAAAARPPARQRCPGYMRQRRAAATGSRTNVLGIGCARQSVHKFLRRARVSAACSPAWLRCGRLTCPQCRAGSTCCTASARVAVGGMRPQGASNPGAESCAPPLDNPRCKGKGYLHTTLSMKSIIVSQSSSLQWHRQHHHQSSCARRPRNTVHHHSYSERAPAHHLARRSASCVGPTSGHPVVAAPRSAAATEDAALRPRVAAAAAGPAGRRMPRPRRAVPCGCRDAGHGGHLSTGRQP